MLLPRSDQDTAVVQNIALGHSGKEVVKAEEADEVGDYARIFVKEDLSAGRDGGCRVGLLPRFEPGDAGER